MAYGARLESGLGETPRGFKSRILRTSQSSPCSLIISRSRLNMLLLRPQRLLASADRNDSHAEDWAEVKSGLEQSVASKLS